MNLKWIYSLRIDSNTVLFTIPTFSYKTATLIILDMTVSSPTTLLLQYLVFPYIYYTAASKAQTRVVQQNRTNPPWRPIISINRTRAQGIYRRWYLYRVVLMGGCNTRTCMCVCLGKKGRGEAINKRRASCTVWQPSRFTRLFFLSCAFPHSSSGASERNFSRL